jgi:ParB-like chromosome segregation protein Spo0J
VSICDYAPQPLHSEPSLINLKLQMFRALATEVLITSLKPGQTGSLKARPDGTMVDGHHRIKVLRDRGVDVDSLPREIVYKS